MGLDGDSTLLFVRLLRFVVSYGAEGDESHSVLNRSWRTHNFLPSFLKSLLKLFFELLCPREHLQLLQNKRHDITDL